MASSIDIKINIFSNKSICPIDETLAGTTTPSQNRPESNSNEEGPQTPKIFRTRASPSDAIYFYSVFEIG